MRSAYASEDTGLQSSYLTFPTIFRTTWRYRLSVRTAGFHPVKRSSTLRSVTNYTFKLYIQKKSVCKYGLFSSLFLGLVITKFVFSFCIGSLKTEFLLYENYMNTPRSSFFIYK